jgi:DNA-binding transcriptional LysR family regulator
MGAILRPVLAFVQCISIIYTMRVAQLGEIDLNLLPVLAALLDERHVSRAAERVNLSQPATSRALRRLREALGDELLIREPGGYQLTPRAERLRRQLTLVLPRLQEVISDQPFDPATAATTFRIAGLDWVLQILGPGLSQRVFTHSPLTTLMCLPWHGAIFDDLQRGCLDLAFRAIAAPRNLRSESLFVEPYVCLLSSTHPLAAREHLRLQEYLDCMHVSVEGGGGGQPTVERRLSTISARRAISLAVPYAAVAARMVAGTPLVATLAARLAAEHAGDPGLRIVRAPPEIAPLAIRMVWHPRLDDDPAQGWLREVVRTVARGLDDGDGLGP